VNKIAAMKAAITEVTFRIFVPLVTL